MSSPHVDSVHIDCRASIGRLEQELARVVRENDHLRERHIEILTRCDSLLEERRAADREVEQLRRELARLRQRDAHLTFAGGRLGGHDDA